MPKTRDLDFSRCVAPEDSRWLALLAAGDVASALAGLEGVPDYRARIGLLAPTAACPGAVGILTRVVRTDSDARVRLAATSLLRQTGPEGVAARVELWLLAHRLLTGGPASSEDALGWPRS